MFPPTRRPPKRIGGAPFTASALARRAPQRRHPHSARTSTRLERGDAKASTAMPLSARGTSSGPELTHGSRGDGSDTPCKRRAEEYYSFLLGKASGAETRQDWKLVQEVDALDFFKREESNRRHERDKQLKHQAELKDQMQTQGLIAEKCKDVWRQWRSELEEDVVAYRKEEEVKRAFSLETQRRFNQEREKQLEETKRRRDLQREHEKRLEEEMMKQAEQAKRRQDEADLTRKTQQRQAAKQMQSQAELAHERRQQAKKEEHEQDIKMQKKYADLLDEQERNRGKYFQEMRDKQSRLLAHYESGVGNELARLQKRDDERARKQAEARDEKERQAYEERELWRQRLAESGRKAVQQQLAIQAEERVRQQEEELRYVAKVKKDSEIAEAKEAENVKRKKEAMLQNAEHLRKQIEEKEAQGPIRRVQQAQMNDVERSLNREKLERAYESDGLQQLINRKRNEYRQQAAIPSVTMPC